MAQTLNKFLIEKPPDADLSKLPDRLRQKLLPFQREGLNYAVSKNGRCLIGDEMGLGKTIQAIATACYYQSEWPLLIIVPASLKYQWVEELEKWLPNILPTDINMVNSSCDVGNISRCKISILPYSLVRYGNPEKSVLLKAIRAQKFKVMICDESHNIRNKTSRTSNVTVDLIKSSIRCILLSGTPALNKPVELFTQIDAILPGRFGTYNEYTKRYCDAKYVHYGRAKVWNVSGSKNLIELELKLKQHLMVRRLKKNVLTQLPPKRRQKVPFDLKFDTKSSELQKELTAMQEELDRLLSSSGASIAQAIQPSQGGPASPGMFEIRSLISQLYTKTCQAKVAPVVEFVSMYTGGEDDNKVLVFAHHHNMLNGIQQSLWDASIKHIRIDGKVPTDERNQLVKQFQTDPKTRVAVLSILAAGTGLTLTAASVVVFAELYWTPAILMQCEDRAHRIGQTAQSVNIYYLVARGTIDERVWSMVEKKTRVLAMALDGQKKGLSAINSNKHVSDILSSANVQAEEEGDEKVQVDIDVEDYFTLAELKGQNQPRLLDFMTPDGKIRSIPKKKKKRLLIRPAEVVDIMDGDSDNEGTTSKPKKKPRLSDDQFMAWALGGKNIADLPKPGSPTSDSLPSLSSSSPGLISDDEDIKEIKRSEVSSPESELKQKTKPDNDDVIGPSDHDEDDDVTLLDSSGVSGTINDVLRTKDESSADTKYTGIKRDKKSYSPVDLENIGKTWDTCSGATFNLLPGKLGDGSGSDLSADLFSDASFEDEILADLEKDEDAKRHGKAGPSGATPGMSQTDKDEEARLAAELLGGDDFGDGESDTEWNCLCGHVNKIDDECCSQCALPQMPTTWLCKKCQTLNRQTDTSCDECFTDRDSGKDELGEEERIVDLSKIPKHKMFYFLVSQHTSRIFLHDENKEFLESSFHAVDIDNPDSLPDLLLKPENFELAKEFVNKWNELKKREQKALVKKGELIDCPQRAYFGGRLTKLKNPNKQRYKSKADVAKEAARICEANPGAQTRHIQKPGWNEKRASTSMESGSESDAGYIQVMSANNKPLCIKCHSEYDSGLLSDTVISDEKFAWQTRFCSPQCADQFWMTTNGGYIRDTAKSLDAGVCQQCGVNGSELFRKIRANKSLKERAELLQKSRYSSLSTAVKVSMVKDPHEGQFWHVDHILPVYAGGGQCDVDNLRTLCTPCHQIVTTAQAGHRARMKSAVGNQTITDYFSPGTKIKLKSMN